MTILSKEVLTNRLQELKKQKEQAILTVHVVDGAMQEIEHLLGKLDKSENNEEVNK